MSEIKKDNSNISKIDEDTLNEVSGGINHGGFIDNIIKILRPSDEKDIKDKKD